MRLPDVSYGTPRVHKLHFNRQSKSVNKNEVLLVTGEGVGCDSAAAVIERRHLAREARHLPHKYLYLQ